MDTKNSSFQKLTPINNVDLKIYDDALNFVFTNEDIKNIAISGSYSAGKSSVIETYKRAHPNKKFLHISLAHFESTDLDSNSPISSKTVLEGKILNQLIHQIDPGKIPQTYFKLKRTVSPWVNIINTSIIIIFMILAVYIGYFKNWCQFVSLLSEKWVKNLLSWTTNSIFIIISGVICTAILGFWVHSIIKTQKYKNFFKRVKVQGNEIEIFEEKDESYFDKYLNEVLYLFENSNVNAFVFEDMDRYNVNQIFEKLREINTLVNNKKNKPIRFIYLLRDDIFVSKDRTKFFDFIIPVIPIIDSSNSYDQFIELFRQGGILNLFDENFMQGLSLYVDDMRILKNIYNEFVIYYNRIQFTELNSNKFLSIIAYKNIFPRDFSDLQLGRGYVNTLFESKGIFIIKELQSIDSQINRINENINLTDKELMDSIDELDAAYLLLNYQIYSVNNKSRSEYKTQMQLVKAMKEYPNNIQYYDSGGLYKIDMTPEFNKIKQNPEYIKRKEAIERKTGNQIEKLKIEVQELQNKKTIIENSRLQAIITKESIDTIFNVIFVNEIGEENKFVEIKASPYFPLIKYLVRNGYIDETYPDYMTYFYENSLSRIDKIFLRSVTDEIPKEYSYSLKNPKLVLSRLRVVDFDHEEILNFDLLCYLLKTKQDNIMYLERFFKQLIETKNYKFIGEFFGTWRETDLFIQNINHFWPSIIQCLLTESDFSETLKKQYAVNTLYFSPDADIVVLNNSAHFSKFISGTPTFLDIAAPNIPKLVTGFKLIDVRFERIEYSTSNKDLFDAVYKNDMYKLNFDNISLMLKNVYGFSESSDFCSKNYTLVISKPDEPLARYVDENIDDYIATVINNCSKFITDEETAVLSILNNSKVENSSKEKYIRFLQTVIDRIEDVIHKELWSSLLQQKRVKYSGENILCYFFLEKKLDSLLIQFINGNCDGLFFNANYVKEKYGEDAASLFFTSIVTCNDLLNEKYTQILQSLNRYYKSFSTSGISDEKVLILIKLNIIRMETPVLKFMRENYPDQVIPFVTQNISQYTKDIITEENFILSEMLLLLEENISDEYKIELLQYTTAQLSLQQKKYSNAVKLHILTHNFDLNDIPFLLKKYSQENTGIKEAIKHIAIEYITDIVENHYEITYELLSDLFAINQLTAEIKKNLFVIYLPNMDEAEVKKHLLTLKMNNFYSLFDRKRPMKFETNPVNEKILLIFMQKHWITKFEADKDEPNYYRVYRR